MNSGSSIGHSPISGRDALTGVLMRRYNNFNVEAAGVPHAVITNLRRAIDN